MNRLIVIGEGPTEQEFCRDLLFPHFIEKNIIIENPKIKLSKGGIVPWPKLKEEVEIYLKSDKTAYLTTLIDFYGLKDFHKFPAWESKQFPDVAGRITAIETAMKDEIDEQNSSRFIPYIQMHEFEALIFSDANVIRENFEADEIVNPTLLSQTESDFTCPEDINNNPTTAPSKRLQSIFKTYNKVQFGSLLLQEIGLSKVRERCPRFDKWMSNLESIGN